MYSTIILSAAFFQLSSALFAPRHLVGDSPEFAFIRLEGACRTPALTTGTFITLQDVDRAECETECLREVGCVAYEYNEQRQCEIHSEAITQTVPGIFGVTCDIKTTSKTTEPEPEIVFCAADTFECPGVNDIFLSRDPNNNCKFNFDECPQVQPRPGPQIINEQIEFRVQPGFCRTADLGAGMPKRLRLNRLQCQQECELDKWCTAYEYRNAHVCEIHSTPAITQVVPAPDDSVCGLKLNYIRFEGYCHTEENPAIIMKRTQGRTACEEECTSDPKCVGYEYASEPTDLDCELHFSKLVSIAPAFDGSTCDVIEFLHPGFPFF